MAEGATDLTRREPDQIRGDIARTRKRLDELADMITLQLRSPGNMARTARRFAWDHKGLAGAVVGTFLILAAVAYRAIKNLAPLRWYRFMKDPWRTIRRSKMLKA